MKTYLDDEEFGRMWVTARRGMRNISFRWKNDHLELGVPYGVAVGVILDAVEKNRAKLRALMRPSVTFSVGQVIPLFHTHVVINEDARLRNQVVRGWNREEDHLYVNIPVGTNLDDEHVKQVISHSLSALMEVHAKRLILPYATRIAESLGLHPTRFEIGRGMRKLGHCTTKGVIQLSRNLMFMNEQMVEYVVCHELAHLTHMDHSPAFHELLTKYLGEPDRHREHEVDHFVFPILK